VEAEPYQVDKDTYDCEALLSALIVVERDGEYVVIGKIPYNRYCPYAIAAGVKCGWRGVPMVRGGRSKSTHKKSCIAYQDLRLKCANIWTERRNRYRSHLSLDLRNEFLIGDDGASNLYFSQCVDSMIDAYAGSQGFWHRTIGKRIDMTPLVTAWLNGQMSLPLEWAGENGLQWMACFISQSHEVVLCARYLIDRLIKLIKYCRPYYSLCEKQSAILHRMQPSLPIMSQSLPPPIPQIETAGLSQVWLSIISVCDSYSVLFFAICGRSLSLQVI